MPGYHADDSGVSRRVGEKRRQAGGRRGLAEEALFAGENPPGVEDRLVGNRRRRAARVGQRALRLRFVCRLDDADRGGRRSCPVGRLRGDEAGKRAQLPEAERVGAEVPASAVRKREDIGRATELLGDLEGGRLLALET